MRRRKAGKLAIAGVLLGFVSCGKEQIHNLTAVSSPTAGVKGVEKGEKDVRVEIGAETNQVRFYYLDQAGEKRFFDPMYDSVVEAYPSLDGFQLKYEGVEIGLATPEKLYLCNRYVIQGERKAFPCNANFYTPNAAPSEFNPYQLGSKNYSVDISLATLPDNANKSAQSIKIDLSRYAQNQINQYGTATCAYNAATGIMEMLYAMKTGSLINFSEPYFLVKAPASYGEDWFWTMYDRTGRETKSLVQNRYLPVTSIYKSSYDFSAARKAAISRLQQNRTPATRLPYSMHAEKIFWHGKWNNEPTNERDFEKTIRWFKKHRMPINIHHVINGYWHSVILIGHDPATDRILIKDSLGNTHVKGTWKSKRWFVNYAYGAIGITSSQIKN